MLVVRCGDDHDISEFRDFKNFAIMSESMLLRDSVLVTHCILSAFENVGYSHDLKVIRESFRVACVQSSTVAGAYHYCGDLLVGAWSEGADVGFDLAVVKCEICGFCR